LEVGIGNRNGRAYPNYQCMNVKDGGQMPNCWF
jgi:hypothetical protein